MPKLTGLPAVTKGSFLHSGINTFNVCIWTISSIKSYSMNSQWRKDRIFRNITGPPWKLSFFRMHSRLLLWTFSYDLWCCWEVWTFPFFFLYIFCCHTARNPPWRVVLFFQAIRSSTICLPFLLPTILMNFLISILLLAIMVFIVFRWCLIIRVVAQYHLQVISTFNICNYRSRKSRIQPIFSKKGRYNSIVCNVDLLFHMCFS